MNRLIRLLAVWLALACLAGDAAAIVGNPLTPMSYAGVARRTTRRTVYRQEALYGGGGARYVTTLPAGCAGVTMGNVAYQRCGAVYYRPYYDGPNLVYTVATP